MPKKVSLGRDVLVTQLVYILFLTHILTTTYSKYIFFGNKPKRIKIFHKKIKIVTYVKLVSRTVKFGYLHPVRILRQYGAMHSFESYFPDVAHSSVFSVS